MMRAIVYAALVLATSASAFAEPTANEQIVREYLAAVGQPGHAGWTEHLSETVSFNGREIPPAELAAFLGGIRAGFPDLEFVIIGQIAEGDRVATWGRFHGTHTGSFAGIPPTGRKVEWLGIAVDRIENGKIVEMWHEMDLHGLLRQLKATAAE
jgi:predicted ester cyclase